MGNIPCSPGGADAETDNPKGYLYYRGKKYPPSQQQIDAAYDEMKNAYSREFAKRWCGVNKKLLAEKLLAKLQEEHPEFFSPSSPSSSSSSSSTDYEKEAADEDATTTAGIIPSPPITQKRRKVEGGPMIIHGLRIPREVVANILPYCNRLSINNLSLTCRGAFQIIQDRKLVKALPWPVHRPWTKAHWEVHADWEIGASKDLSKFVVDIFRERFQSLHITQIWDRVHGLLGELEWYATMHMPFKPVFSPDGSLMLSPLAIKNEADNWRIRGVQAVQLPLGGVEEGPIVVSDHSFHAGQHNVLSVEFVSNDTIAVSAWEDLDFTNHGIHIWKINRENGNISLSFSRIILEHQLDRTASKVSSFTSGANTFLTFLPYNGANHIIIHDLEGNESVTKTLVDRVRCLAFSPNGELVVSVFHEQRERHDGLLAYLYSGELFAFDCKVSAIGEIGESRSICNINEGYYDDIIAFSSDGTKIAVRLRHPVHENRVNGHNHVIDLQKGEVICDRFLNDDEWDESAWEDFVNKE